MGRSLVVLSVVLVLAGPGCAVGIRQQATGITGEGATLNGKALSTTGGPGSWFIEYSQLPQPATPTTETTPTRTVDFVAGEARPVSESVHGLAPGRAHYYRVCAEDGENPGDPFCSPFQSFRTVGDSVSGRGVDSVVGDLESSISFEIGGGPSGEASRASRSRRPCRAEAPSGRRSVSP